MRERLKQLYNSNIVLNIPTSQEWRIGKELKLI